MGGRWEEWCRSWADGRSTSCMLPLLATDSASDGPTRTCPSLQTYYHHLAATSEGSNRLEKYTPRRHLQYHDSGAYRHYLLPSGGWLALLRYSTHFRGLHRPLLTTMPGMAALPDSYTNSRTNSKTVALARASYKLSAATHTAATPTTTPRPSRRATCAPSAAYSA